MGKPKLTLDEILDIVLPMIKQGQVEVPSFKDWVSNVSKEIRANPRVQMKDSRRRNWNGE
jgi:hypothetical protein